MRNIIKSFCGCFTGPDASLDMFHVFSNRVPLAAGGRDTLPVSLALGTLGKKELKYAVIFDRILAYSFFL
jgi:hypothetical protein